MFTQGRPLQILEKIRATKPVALHGVAMSIGSERQGRSEYLHALKILIDRIDPWLVSDHFCWSGTNLHNSFDLLPIPFTQESIGRVVATIDEVQSCLKRKIYLENVSAYVGFKNAEMSEIEFINAVIQRSGCGLLLDVNNVYVNAHNFRFDPLDFIDQVIPSAVGEIHLAGHSVVDDFLFDTHDGPVCAEVWKLYRYAIARLGPTPTLIEWDESIPDFASLNDQRLIAERVSIGCLTGVDDASRHHSELNI